jgi:hypothetical protein
MEVNLLTKIRLARNYAVFLRTLKRCGVCFTLAKTYGSQPDKIGDLKDKLCPNCSKALREAGENILKVLSQ